ncbi:MAG: hypothetical protein IKS88_03885, partial [Clostridia bacterium]|nr:hypothetical protein [Clostridia bacterium]
MEENNLNAIPVDTAAEASSAPAADVDASPSRRGGEADENTAAEPSARTRREEFERLISGEYKDVFTERVAGIIGRRFAESRREAEERERASRLREDGDAALAAGFAKRSERVADEAETLYASWLEAAEQVARDYPGFDLAAAVKEPAFRRLLQGGADLRSAY